MVERITLGKGACSRRSTPGTPPATERITLGKGACSRLELLSNRSDGLAYHLGEVRVLKTIQSIGVSRTTAYHLGEVRVLKTA